MDCLLYEEGEEPGERAWWAGRVRRVMREGGAERRGGQRGGEGEGWESGICLCWTAD